MNLTVSIWNLFPFAAQFCKLLQDIPPKLSNSCTIIEDAIRRDMRKFRAILKKRLSAAESKTRLRLQFDESVKQQKLEVSRLERKLRRVKELAAKVNVRS